MFLQEESRDGVILFFKINFIARRLGGDSRVDLLRDATLTRTRR